MRLLSASKSIFVITLIVAVLLAGCGEDATPDLSFTPAPGSTPDTGGTGGTGEDSSEASPVVAYVNNQPISTEAYNRELARFEAGRAALGFEVSETGDYRQQVLDLLIEYELIRQKAQAEGVTVSEEEINAFINDMVAESGQEYFNSWLQSNYYTMEEFREMVRISLLTEKMLQPVIASVPQSTDHVHARHILVSSENQAQTILEQIRNGEDFAALAAEYSTDVTTRDNGGDLGWFPRGGLLMPEVEEAAFNMQPGETSGVISSAAGYHIVQTLEFDPNREVNPDTRQWLIEQAIEQWRLQLRNGADVQQMISLNS